MSQRLFIFILEIVKLIVIAISAYTTGKGIVFGADLNGTLLLLAAPVTLIGATLLTFYQTLEARIADDTLKPNDIVGMFGLSGFWIMQVSTLSGELTLFGYAIIPPESQAVIVTMLQTMSVVILWSFGRRTPGDEMLSRERAVVVQYAKRREADQEQPRLGT